MHERTQTHRRVVFGSGCLIACSLMTVAPRFAHGQTPPPGESMGEGTPGVGEPRASAAAEPAPPIVVAPPVVAPPVVAPPVVAPPVAAAIPVGVVPKGPVPPAPPPAIPNIDYGGRLRTSVRFQSTSNPKSFGDVSQTIYADLYAGGQISTMWKWLLAVTTNDYGGGTGASSNAPIALLDAIAEFTPLPEFQIYAGRLLVMADRYAPGGPWGMDEWFYPGFFVGTPPAVPKAGPSGRDLGVVAWGAPLGGHLKYYLGAYQLQDPTLSPLLSGRVQVSLLSPEAGWFHRTTYYGERDLVSIGVGGQSQRNGSVMTLPPAMMGMTPPPAMLGDYREVNADLVVEKRIGDLGALSLEGAYYNFHGTYQPWKWSAVAAVAYTSPVLAGFGRLRPSFRFQQAQAQQVTASGASLDPTRVYDVQLTYSVMAWFAHVVVNYRHYDVVYASSSSAPPAAGPAASAGNMIVVGVQLWDP